MTRDDIEEIVNFVTDLGDDATAVIAPATRDRLKEIVAEAIATDGDEAYDEAAQLAAYVEDGLTGRELAEFEIRLSQSTDLRLQLETIKENITLADAGTEVPISLMHRVEALAGPRPASHRSGWSAFLQGLLGLIERIGAWLVPGGTGLTAGNVTAAVAIFAVGALGGGSVVQIYLDQNQEAQLTRNWLVVSGGIDAQKSLSAPSRDRLDAAASTDRLDAYGRLALAMFATKTVEHAERSLTIDLDSDLSEIIRFHTAGRTDESEAALISAVQAATGLQDGQVVAIHVLPSLLDQIVGERAARIRLDVFEDGVLLISYELNSLSPGADLEFGDDASLYARDLRCDDGRFTGAGMAPDLDDFSIGHDASDCGALFEAGIIEIDIER